jgi:uncharacterized protein (TIGR02246 family)
MMALLLAWMAIIPAAADAPMVMRVDTSIAQAADDELAAVRAEFVAAANARDAGRLTALYAPDALVSLPDGMSLTGSEIGQHFRETFASPAPAATVTLTPHRFEMRGDVGAESGTFVETAASGEGGAIATGAYVTIYSRGADGRWRISIDVRTTGAHPPAVAW